MCSLFLTNTVINTELNFSILGLKGSLSSLVKTASVLNTININIETLDTDAIMIPYRSLPLSHGEHSLSFLSPPGSFALLLLEVNSNFFVTDHYLMLILFFPRLFSNS